jgi:hypothetical protein
VDVFVALLEKRTTLMSFMEWVHAQIGSVPYTKDLGLVVAPHSTMLTVKYPSTLREWVVKTRLYWERDLDAAIVAVSMRSAQ